MAIVVDHTPAGLTSVIAAGLANAETRRRKEYDDNQALDTRRLDIAQRGQDLAQRQFEAQQADIPLARQHARDMIGLQYDSALQLQVQKAELERAEKERQEFASMSPMQKAELRKLDEQESMVRGSGVLLPEAADEMLAQIEQKRYAIRSQRGMKQSPYPPGQGVGDIWFDKRFKAPLTRKANGEVVSLNDYDSLGMTKPPSFTDFSKAVNEYIAANSTPERQVTIEEASKAIFGLYSNFRAVMGENGQDQQVEGDPAAQDQPATGESSFIGPLPPASAATPQAAAAKAADDALMQSVQSTVPAGFDTKKVYSNGNISIVGEHILKAAVNHARKTGQVVPIADFMRDVLKIPVSSLGPAGAASPRAGVLKLSPDQIKSKGPHPTVATAGAEYAKRPESPGRNQTAKYGNISEW